MPMVTTPDGRQMWVPDQLAPPSPVGALAEPSIPEPSPPPPPGGMPIPAPAPQPPPVMTPPPVPAPASGSVGHDFVAATVDNDPKVLAAKSQAFAKQQTQQAKAQKQQQQFAATTEGQAQQAGTDQAQAKAQESTNAMNQGYVEAKQLDEAANLEQAGFDRAEKIRQDAASEQAARAAGLAEKGKSLDQAVKTELDFKVDDNRRWADMGTGKKTMFWISTALSGLGDALQHKSGPLMPLQMLQQAIQDDVAAQVRDHESISKRIGIAKSSLDNYRQVTGDMADASKLKLSEEYDRTAAQVRLVASKYGSDKAKLRGEQMAISLEGDAAKIRAGTAESAFGRDMQRQQMANAKSNTSLGWANLSEHKYEFKEQQKLEAAKIDAESQKLAAKGNAAGAAQIRELGVTAPPKEVRDAEGNVTGITRDTGVLKNADGSAWLMPTKEEAMKFRDKKMAADSVVDIIDEIRGIRDRSGGESSWGNSDDYQRLQVLKQNLILLKKAGTQGMSSDADMDRIIGSLGAANPASFRAQAAGLEAGRTQTIKQLNTAAGVYGYTGEPIKYADPVSTKPTATQEDKDYQATLNSEGVAWNNNQLVRNTPGDIAGADKLEKTVNSLVARATDPKSSSSQRDAALSRLYEGSQKGANSGVKQLFQSALQRTAQSGLNATTGSEETETRARYP